MDKTIAFKFVTYKTINTQVKAAEYTIILFLMIMRYAVLFYFPLLTLNLKLTINNKTMQIFFFPAA